MGKVVTNGSISIGYHYFRGVRKRPCILVQIGNEYFNLGTFANEVNAEFFVDKLAEFFARKSPCDYYCNYSKRVCNGVSCKQGILDWLKSPTND